jgi:hypothetical protein
MAIDLKLSLVFLDEAKKPLAQRRGHGEEPVCRVVTLPI